jgi:hypothetical protein
MARQGPGGPPGCDNSAPQVAAAANELTVPPGGDLTRTVRPT